MHRVILAVCLVVLCALPARAQTMESSEGAWYRIHLGTGVGDKAVSRDLLKSFIDQQITSHFPNGLTITDARGQWKSEEYGVIRERTIVIDIRCPDTEESSNKIAEIAKGYVERFKGAKASVYVTKISGVASTLYY